MINNLDCIFLSGKEDYTYAGFYGNLEVKETDDGNSVITTYINMATDSYISGGFAKLGNDDVTLTIKSYDNGSICFEQYSLEVSFIIKTELLPTQATYILEREHETRGSEDELL